MLPEDLRGKEDFLLPVGRRSEDSVVQPSLLPRSQLREVSEEGGMPYLISSYQVGLGLSSSIFPAGEDLARFLAI